MLKHDSIPTLTPDLVSACLDDYPKQVLDCEWNPALEEALRLRDSRLKPPSGLYLHTLPPDSAEQSN